MKRLNLSKITLSAGMHKHRSDGVCLSEAVAWYARERHSSQPKCMSRVIGAFADRIWCIVFDDREATRLLRPMIPRLAKSSGPRALEIRRAYAIADYVARVETPLALESLGQVDAAKKLRSAPKIIDSATAKETAGWVVSAGSYPLDAQERKISIRAAYAAKYAASAETERNDAVCIGGLVGVAGISAYVFDDTCHAVCRRIHDSMESKCKLHRQNMDTSVPGYEETLREQYKEEQEKAQAEMKSARTDIGKRGVEAIELLLAVT